MCDGNVKKRKKDEPPFGLRVYSAAMPVTFLCVGLFCCAHRVAVGVVVVVVVVEAVGMALWVN